MKHSIENKKIWIQCTGGTVSILATADEQQCTECQESKWIVFLSKNGEFHDCNPCVDCMTKTQSRYCPYCNKTAPMPEGPNDDKICDKCVTGLVACTKELYKICKVPNETCKCKYCKILGRA